MASNIRNPNTENQKMASKPKKVVIKKNTTTCNKILYHKK